MKNMKMAAIGEKDIMLIFKAVGVDVFSAENKEEAEQAIKKINKNIYGIIFITETIAKQINELILEYSHIMSPSIVIVPGLKEKSNYAINKLRNSIIKAIGADIISEK